MNTSVFVSNGPVSVLLSRACARHKTLCSVQALCFSLGSDFSVSIFFCLWLLFVSDVCLSVYRLCLVLVIIMAFRLML